MTFVEKKIMEAGYDDILTFTSSVMEAEPSKPIPAGFDCPQGVSVKTSSTLARQGKYSYDATNVLTKANAWSEGVEGEGVGEWIEFTLKGNDHVGAIWQIGNGNHLNKDVWQENNRIKKLKVLVDNQMIGYVVLANVYAYQEFNIAPDWLKQQPQFKRGTRIRFVIEEVYKGSKYNDTVISYFVPIGNCS